MSHSEMPSISICLSWLSGGSGRDGKSCRGWRVFHHVLIMNLLHVEDCFRGVVLLNPKVNVIPVVSGLPELLVRHDVCMETGDMGNVLELEELPAYGRVDIDLDLAIAVHI